MPSDTGGVPREGCVYGGRNQSTVKFTKNCGSKLHNQQHDEHKLESKESIETLCWLNVIGDLFESDCWL